MTSRGGPQERIQGALTVAISLALTTVRDYQTRFESLLAKVGHLPPVHQVSCFMSGLKDGIKANVLVGRPKDLSTAFGLAQLFEARNLSLWRTSTPLVTTTIPTSFTPKDDNTSRPPFVVHRMTPAKLKEQCDKGLCYNCNEKFSPSHQCKKLFLLKLIRPRKWKT